MEERAGKERKGERERGEERERVRKEGEEMGNGEWREKGGRPITIQNTERGMLLTKPFLTVRVNHATDESGVDCFSVSLSFYQLQHRIRDLHKNHKSFQFSPTHAHTPTHPNVHWLEDAILPRQQ